jgi:soluble lytic murein transglycosylase-like protein
MKHLALALAVAAVFAAGCDDKDQGSASPRSSAAQQADLAKKSPAAAALMNFAGPGGGLAAGQGDPGRLQFDGQALGYADPGGGVYAGAARSYGPRAPIQYTSTRANYIPSDLSLAGPPTPLAGGAQAYAGLRSALIRRGSDARVVDEAINQSLNKGMDPLMTLAIGSQESGLRNNSTSPVGARGAMQLMPATACGLGVCNTAALYNPTVNVGLGTTYFKDMLNTFGRVDLAIAAYNAGPGAVQKYRGVPPYAETQNYVYKVLGYYRQFRNFLSQSQTQAV